MLIKFREGILEQIRNHPHVRQGKYEVVVNDLGSSGIQLLIQVFFEVPDYHAELLTRDSLILDILRLAERLGIAFDTPTLLLERANPKRFSHTGGTLIRVPRYQSTDRCTHHCIMDSRPGIV